MSDSDKEPEREEQLLRPDSLPFRRFKARQLKKGSAYARDSREHDLSWQAKSDGPNGVHDYLGPRHNGHDDDLMRENAFWDKNNTPRVTRGVAITSLASNEKGYNHRTGIDSAENCQHYWDKAREEMVQHKNQRFQRHSHHRCLETSHTHTHTHTRTHPHTHTHMQTYAHTHIHI